LASFGAGVSLISTAGQDEAGRALVEKLNAAGVDCSGVVVSEKIRTTTKVRILAGQLNSTRQQVIRIDYEGEPLNDSALRGELLGKHLAPISELESAGEQLRERLGYRALLVTRGSQGMILLEDGVVALHIDAVGAREPVDVTGAGDSVIATYTLALASEASFPD